MKLSLRELFLLVVIAAMGCAWWVDRSSLATEGNKFFNTMVDLSKREFEWQHATGAGSPADFYSRPNRKP